MKSKILRLWGINLAQATVYFRTYKTDRPFLKWLVSFYSPAGLHRLHLTRPLPGCNLRVGILA